MTAGVEPVRLQIRSGAEVDSVRQVAMRHVLARQPVNCFVSLGASAMMAFRARPEQVGTRVIAPDFRCSGIFAAADRVEDAIERAIDAAFRSLREDAEKSAFARER